MAEQEPASQQMRWFFLQAMEYANFRVMAVQEPSFRAKWNQWETHDKLNAQADALYARMQAEEQERAEMRALLKEFTVEMTCEGYCLHCGEAAGTHGEHCPIAQARALLAAHPAQGATGKPASEPAG